MWFKATQKPKKNENNSDDVKMSSQLKYAETVVVSPLLALSYHYFCMVLHVFKLRLGDSGPRPWSLKFKNIQIFILKQNMQYVVVDIWTSK